jgi:hypothetical protein
MDNVRVKFNHEKTLIDQEGFVCYQTPVRFHKLNIVLKNDEGTIMVNGGNVKYMSLNLTSFLLQVDNETITGYPLENIDTLNVEN